MKETNISFPGPSIVETAPAQMQGAHEVKLKRGAAQEAKMQQDFNDFNNTKRYVIENLDYLKDRVIPMDVDQITNLPSHNCILVNDLLLYSYTDVEEIIKRGKEIDAEEDKAKAEAEPVN